MIFSFFFSILITSWIIESTCHFIFLLACWGLFKFQFGVLSSRTHCSQYFLLLISFSLTNFNKSIMIEYWCFFQVSHFLSVLRMKAQRLCTPRVSCAVLWPGRSMSRVSSWCPPVARNKETCSSKWPEWKGGGGLGNLVNGIYRS